MVLGPSLRIAEIQSGLQRDLAAVACELTHGPAGVRERVEHQRAALADRQGEAAGAGGHPVQRASAEEVDSAGDELALGRAFVLGALRGGDRLDDGLVDDPRGRHPEERGRRHEVVPRRGADHVEDQAVVLARKPSRPAPDHIEGAIGDYILVFEMASKGKVGVTYKVEMKLERSNSEFDAMKREEVGFEVTPTARALDRQVASTWVRVGAASRTTTFAPAVLPVAILRGNAALRWRSRARFVTPMRP